MSRSVSVLDDEIESMAKLLRDHHSLNDLAHVSLPVQVGVATCTQND